jgi:hypothetical protein
MIKLGLLESYAIPYIKLSFLVTAAVSDPHAGFRTAHSNPVQDTRLCASYCIFAYDVGSLEVVWYPIQ